MIARSALRVAILAGIGCALAVPAIYGLERLRLREASSRVDPIPGPPPGRFDDRHVFLVPGIDLPPARAASESRIADDEEVIGVVLGGRARAYRLKSMEDRMRHVVNDVVGDVPVTVTYCDLNRCVRAFVRSGQAGPIGVSQAGLKGSKMVIRIDGSDYLQETAEPIDRRSKPFPLSAIEATRTTWKAWLSAHPGTDVVDPRIKAP